MIFTTLIAALIAPAASATAATIEQISGDYVGWIEVDGHFMASGPDNEETNYRDWVTLTDDSRAAAEVGSNEVVAAANQHAYYFHTIDNSPGCPQRSESFGSGAGQGAYRFDRGESNSLEITIRRNLTFGTIGVVQFCGDDAPSPGSWPSNGGVVDWPLRVPGDADDAPLTISVTHGQVGPEITGQANYKLTYSACLTRATADGDGDGLPDPVDLDPTLAAPLSDLGIPGGPPRTTDSPKMPDGPTDVHGIAGCSAGSAPGEPPPPPPAAPPPAAGIQLGSACGKARFDFHDVVHARSFVRKGKQACVLLASNRTAMALLQMAYADTGTANISEKLVDALRRSYKVENTKPGTPERLAYEKTRDDLLDHGKDELIKRYFPRFASARQTGKAIAARASPLFFIGALAASPAIALTTLHRIHQIQTKGACLQFVMAVVKKKVKIESRVIYNPKHFKDRSGSLARVYEKRPRRFRSDRFIRRDVAFKCNANGEVQKVSPGAAFQKTEITAPKWTG